MAKFLLAFFSFPCFDLILLMFIKDFFFLLYLDRRPSHGEFGCYANDFVDRHGYPILGGPNGHWLLLPPSAS